MTQDRQKEFQTLACAQDNVNRLLCEITIHSVHDPLIILLKLSYKLALLPDNFTYRTSNAVKD